MEITLLLFTLPLAWSCFRPLPPTTPSPPLTNCLCGVSKTSNKIVGGVNTAKNEFPWQVRLKSSSVGLCGGTLLSSTTVLTAAHCKGFGFTAYLGDHDQYSQDAEISIPVRSFENHPGYNSRTYDNDFAIVTLETPVTFTNNIYPICLPTAKNYDNKPAVISGWGTLYSNGPVSRILQKAAVRTMSNSDCSSSSTQYSAGDITNNMICASAPGKDSCQGDSGGPLVVQKEGANYYEIAGVVSWGFGCAQADAPGVYARVTSQLNWIKSKRAGATCARPTRQGETQGRMFWGGQPFFF